MSTEAKTKLVEKTQIYILCIDNNPSANDEFYTGKIKINEKRKP